MSVVNPAKRALAKGVKYKTISRKQFRGDPGLLPVTHNPEALTGSRKLDSEYENNKAKRKMQKAPAARSSPTRRGPTKRAQGISHTQWCNIMAGK